MTDALPFCPSCGINLRAEGPVEVGPLAVDPHGSALWAGASIGLTGGQHSILSTLARAGGRIVRTSVIAERLGSDSDGNVVQVLVHRLRRSLRAAGAPATLIQNVPQRGYRLNLEDLPLCR